MIVNETTIHKRPNDPNDTDINNYKSPYGLQQLEQSPYRIIAVYTYTCRQHSQLVVVISRM